MVLTPKIDSKNEPYVYGYDDLDIMMLVSNDDVVVIW